MNRYLSGPAATVAFGQQWACVLAEMKEGVVVTLAGELGAGKTALVRAVIQGLGHKGAVVSPSYTLVEPYPVVGRTVHHLDLYRLGDPEELEFLGVRDIATARDLVFIEWADRGRGFLPPTDLAVEIDYAGNGRDLNMTAHSAAGHKILERLVATR